MKSIIFFLSFHEKKIKRQKTYTASRIIERVNTIKNDEILLSKGLLLLQIQSLFSSNPASSTQNYDINQTSAARERKKR